MTRRGVILVNVDDLVTWNARPMGPTRLGEWLMVDVRVARGIDQASRLWEICARLGEKGACGVVASTLVVDLLDATVADRAYLLDTRNWPRPATQETTCQN